MFAKIKAVLIERLTSVLVGIILSLFSTLTYSVLDILEKNELIESKDQSLNYLGEYIVENSIEKTTKESILRSIKPIDNGYILQIECR